MEITEQQFAKLMAYFDNRLTPAEEIAFIEEVAGSEALKEEFNREMLWRTELEAHPYQVAAGFESVDEHIGKAKELIAAHYKNSVRKRPLLRLAAALALLVAVTAQQHCSFI